MSIDLLAPLLLLGMILSLGVILFAAYTVYVDPRADQEHKVNMYMFYAALIVIDASIGVAWRIFLQSGG